MRKATFYVASIGCLCALIAGFSTLRSTPVEAQPPVQTGNGTVTPKPITVRDVLQLKNKEFLQATQNYLFEYRIGKVEPLLQELWLLMERLETERKQVPEKNEGRGNIELIITYGQLVEAISNRGGD